MAIVLETTLGDLTIDLFIKERPKACINFLKLCKMKYYNFNLFHTVQQEFLAQTGDPSGSGTGGESIWGVLHGEERRYFEGDEQPKIRHTNVGTVSLVSTGNNMLGSQFFITLAPNLISLDGIHCVIGEVTEGLDVLRKLNEAICDEEHRPYQDIRITHTVILEDPYPDPDGFTEPDRSPEPTAERLQGGRIGADEEIDETVGKTAEELAEMAAEREAKARATILEMVGDIPDAEMAPPENVLFVCKLNPVTTDDDLEIIFSRFGKINSCEVIRDKQSGDSLQYAFVEFDNKKSCEDAYFKMDNVLIDDRRIHVDFSQSVAKIKWMGKGRGVKHFDDSGKEAKRGKNDISNGKKRVNEKRSRSRSRSRRSRSRSRNRTRRSRSNDRRFNSRDYDSRRNDFQRYRQGNNSWQVNRYDNRRRNDYERNRYEHHRNQMDSRNRYQDRRNYRNETEHRRGRDDPRPRREISSDDDKKLTRKRSVTDSSSSNSPEPPKKAKKHKKKSSKKKKKTHHKSSDESSSSSDSESSSSGEKSRKKSKKKKSRK